MAKKSKDNTNKRLLSSYGDEIDAVTSAAIPYWQRPIKEREDFKGNFLSGIANKLASSGHGAGKEISPKAGNPRKEKYGELYDLYNHYFGQPAESNALKYSRHRPTLSKDPNAKYVSIDNDDFRNQVIDVYNQLPEDKKSQPSVEASGYMTDYKGMSRTGMWLGMYPKEKLQEAYDARNKTTAIGRFRVGKGSDNQGDYISYYDIFDKGTGNEKTPMFGTAKPFEIYDRIYVNKDESGKYIPANSNTQANTNMKTKYATGGQLKKNINKNFYPTYYNMPMLGFGDFLKDSGLLFADTMLSTFGGKNLIPDKAYSSKGFAKASGITSGIAETGAKMVAGAALPGVGDAALGAVQQGVGAAVPDTDAKLAEDLALQQQIEESQKQQLLQQHMAMGGMLNSYASGGSLMDSLPLKEVPNAIDSSLKPMKTLSEKEKYNLQRLSKYYDMQNQEQDLLDYYQSFTDGVQQSNPLREAVNAEERPTLQLPFKATGGSLIEPLPIKLSSGKKQGLMPHSIFDKTRGYGKEGVSYFDEATRLDSELDSLSNLPQPSGRDRVKMNDINKLKQDLITHQMDTKAYGGKLDSITEIKAGGTHEESPYNGVPLGNKALIEEGEIIYKRKNGEKYVFSNRF